MERQIRRAAIAFLVLFGALAINLNYIQVIAAEDLYNNDANLKRQLIEEFNVRRGRILATDRLTVLADSEPTEGDLRFQRAYPTPPDLGYGHLTGFYSLVFGKTELEDTYNDFLSGRAEELFPQRLIDQFLGEEEQGASIVLTIDADLQELAMQELAPQVGADGGAVAAIDPRTGDVLALAAIPTYDPNPLSTHDPEQIRAAWQALDPDSPESPLVSRATDTFFPPGSSFKIVTAAAALENGMTPETTIPNPPQLELPDAPDNPLRNFGGSVCSGGSQITLASALQQSCNVAFGGIGVKIGGEALAEQARRFGFGEEIPFDINFEAGQIFSPEIPNAEALGASQSFTARAAIGQQDVRTNVLHMALIAGSIGNGGVMMQPRLVRDIRDPKGGLIEEIQPEEFGDPMTPENAAALTQMMVSVVEGGTGTAAQVPGVAVAGKTGTAQSAEGEASHAWFVAFAPAEAPEIAVAVMVLGGGNLGREATGGAVSAPIAQALIQEWLGA
jgi:penicillin-binding protein A